MAEHKYIYEVTLKRDSQDAFVGISVDPNSDEYIEFIDWNEDGTEEHAIHTNRNIDSELDQIDAVKSYRIADGYGNYY